MKRQDNSGALCGNQCDERGADLKAEAAAQALMHMMDKRMRRMKILGQAISDTRGEKPYRFRRAGDNLEYAGAR